MQEDLRALLLTVLPRVAWATRPQAGALPSTVLTIVSEVTPYTYAAPVGLVAARVQVDTYSAGYAEAVALDRALAAAVSGYSGTVGGTRFEAIFLDQRFDTVDEVPGTSAPVHRISRDLMVHHKEA